MNLIENQKQYITDFLSKKWPKFGQKGPFLKFPIKCENVIFFPLQRLDLKQTSRHTGSDACDPYQAQRDIILPEMFFFAIFGNKK